MESEEAKAVQTLRDMLLFELGLQSDAVEALFAHDALAGELARFQSWARSCEVELDARLFSFQGCLSRFEWRQRAPVAPNAALSAPNGGAPGSFDLGEY